VIEKVTALYSESVVSQGMTKTIEATALPTPNAANVIGKA